MLRFLGKRETMVCIKKTAMRHKPLNGGSETRVTVTSTHKQGEDGVIVTSGLHARAERANSESGNPPSVGRRLHTVHKRTEIG